MSFDLSDNQITDSMVKVLRQPAESFNNDVRWGSTIKDHSSNWRDLILKADVQNISRRICLSHALSALGRSREYVKWRWHFKPYDPWRDLYVILPEQGHITAIVHAKSRFRNRPETWCWGLLTIKHKMNSSRFPCVSSSGSTTCVCRIVMRYEIPERMWTTRKKRHNDSRQIYWRKTSWLAQCASLPTWRQRIPALASPPSTRIRSPQRPRKHSPSSSVD